ncbi:MAG: 50S ribosomal protein L28 [Myxococcales bacterium]|nr:50S ribosomal protein L28 [Myxococcales bacterium]
MARRCELTGKETMFGHNVSHANNRTNRRFVPNLQKVTLYSDALRKEVKLRICTRALRSVQHNSGLDSYLLSRADAKLAPVGLKLKHQIQKALSAPKKATKAA